MKTVKDYYRERFPENDFQKRKAIWKVLCSDFFQRFVGKNDVVMDIAAGYCEFINNIKCGTKIAVDINPDVKKFANKDVKVVKTPALQIPSSYTGKVNKIFISNFLEHLNTKEEVIETLEKIFSLLKKDGQVLVLQPNISLTGNRYWDFIDHKVALNFNSTQEALRIAGFKLDLSVERFLPYTTKSILPQIPVLIKLYLLLPSRLRLFAGQSFFIATKK